jgi:hypothetical protein
MEQEKLNILVASIQKQQKFIEDIDDFLAQLKPKKKK